MSKSSYLGANVEVTTDSFGGWIGKTNLVIHDMATVVVTVASVAQPNTTNGAQTSGNAHIEGIFSANTLSAPTALRGGTVSTPAILHITSNADFTSTNGTVDITSSINLFTVDANNVVVTSNVVFDGGASKIFLIDAANTTVNTGSFFAKSNTYLSGTNTYITSTELKSTSNTIITGSRIDIDGTTFDVTSNSIFTSASLNANVDVMTIGFSAADALNVNAISDFNANVNIDGILTQTANAVFSGALVNITSVNTTIGDAGTDKLNVNAASDFNANVNIDGVFTVTANATFTGAETFFDNNVTLGATTADTVSILGYVDSNVLPFAATVDLGSDAKPWGNVHTTYVWADTDVESGGQMVLKGSGTKTFRVLSANTSYPTLNILLSTSANGNTVVMAANTTGVHPGANTTYDLGSLASNWLNLYVKDAAVANSAVVSNVLTVNTQANTASLMVRDLTATRVPFVGTAGEIVDSANFVFTSANNTLSVTGNTTVSANLSVTNVVSAANVAATHVGTATLNTSGLATINSMNVVTTATFNANVDLQDSDYLLIGTGNDLQIYHDGLNSYIKDAGTGELIVDASTFRVMNAANTENMIVATEDAGVILYANNVSRIEATLVGANVTGTFGTSGLATLNSANVETTLAVTGTSTLSGNTTFGQNIAISGNLTVLGSTNLATNADFTVNNSISTTSTVNGILTINGNTVIGDATTDIVTLNAKVVNSIIPNANNTFDIGSSTNIYKTITANNFVGNTDWTSVQNKPDPVVTVTLSGDVAGTGNATLTDLASGSITITTTVQANSVALGTDTTGNYMSGVTAGGGITVTHTPSEGSSATIAHADTSSVADVSVNTTDGTVLQDLALTFDTYGHVTGATSASINLDNRYPQVTFKTFTVDDTDTEYTWTETGSAVADGLIDTLTLVSGIDINIDVDETNDAIRIRDTSTLSTVTGRGASTASAITLSNTTDSTTTTTGALIVSGGLGLAKQLRVGGNTTISGLMSVSGNTTFSNNVTIAGDLTVNGTTTTINSTIVSYDDKNLELGSVSSPSDVGADGGGITLKGTTDKTFNWVDATDAWSSSEHINLLSSKEYHVNGISVLNATTLGSGVTGSSLTSVGTLTSGTWNATTIAVNKGGTGQTTYTNGQLLIGNTTGNTLTKTTLTQGQNVTITNGTGSITIAAANTNLGYTTANSIGTLTSSTGTSAVIPAANNTVAGLITAISQTIAGTKTFTSAISANLTGTATHADGASALKPSSGGALIIDGTAQSVPVNYLQVRASNTAQDVLVTTAGTDANVGLLINTKGTGNITLGAGAGNIDLKPVALNLRLWDITSTHYHQFVIGEKTANTTITLPDANVTLVSGTMVPTTGTGATGSWSINANTATQLANTRSIILTGDATGSASFNGTANATITVVIDDDSHNHIISNVDGLQTALDAKAPLAAPTFTTSATISHLTPTLYFDETDAVAPAANTSTWRLRSANSVFLFTNSANTPANVLTLSQAGDLVADGNITAFSDARLKENVVTIDSALNKVSQMRGIYYNRIGDETKTRNVGVIAQEIEKVLPEVVHTREDDIKSVAYGNIVGILIEAIKELSEEVKTLRSKIDV